MDHLSHSALICILLLAIIGCTEPSTALPASTASTATAPRPPPPCAELDAEACATDPRCEAQTRAAIDLEASTSAEPTHLGCLDKSHGCDPTPRAVQDSTGRCFHVSGGCLPEGLREIVVEDGPSPCGGPGAM